MTDLTKIERKFNMFHRARNLSYVTEGDWPRYHRNHYKSAQAATAILQANRDTILEALRDYFERRGYDRRIPYGFSGDGDSCPLACKFDETVDGGEAWPIEVRLFIAAFDRGVFPEYDLAETKNDLTAEHLGHLLDQVYAREAIYPPDEISQVLVAV